MANAPDDARHESKLHVKPHARHGQMHHCSDLLMHNKSWGQEVWSLDAFHTVDFLGSCDSGRDNWL